MKAKIKGGKHRLGKLIAALVVLIVIFTSLVTFITNWEWFSEMGYTQVFFTELFTKLEMGVPIFVVALILVKLYLARLRRKYFEQIASKEDTNKKKLNIISWILSIVTSVIVTITAVPQIWFEYLQYKNSTDFEIADPLFGLDVSFYIFKLDFLDKLNAIAIFTIIVLVVLTVVYYVILLAMRTPDVFKDKAPEEETSEETTNSNPFANSPFGKAFEKMGVNPNAAFQNAGFAPQRKPKRELDKGNISQLLKIASKALSVLGFIFFIMVAVDYALKQFQLLYAHNGVVYGAGFTDVNVTLWKYRIIGALAIIGAFLFVIYMAKKKYKKIVLIPVALIVVGIIGSGVG